MAASKYDYLPEGLLQPGEIFTRWCELPRLYQRHDASTSQWLVVSKRLPNLPEHRWDPRRPYPGMRVLKVFDGCPDPVVYYAQKIVMPEPVAVLGPLCLDPEPWVA